MKTKILIGAAIGALAATTAIVAHAQPVPGAVIAVIDTDRIRANCTACVTVIATLRTQGQQLEARTSQLATPLQTEQQALQAVVGALPQGGQPDAALAARIQAFQRNQQAAETEIGQGRQRLQRNVQYIREQIDTAINAATPDIMRARGANIAIDRGVTIATAPTVDITDAVLGAVNARLTTINPNAPAPAAAAPTAVPTAPTGPVANPTTPRPRPRGR